MAHEQMLEGLEARKEEIKIVLLRERLVLIHISLIYKYTYLVKGWQLGQTQQLIFTCRQINNVK